MSKKKVHGEVKFLKARQKTALENLLGRRSDADLLIDVNLAKRIAKLSSEFDALLGVLIGRDGKVCDVILGTKTRIYLPDFGRLRLSESRLRRLRFIVFAPSATLDFFTEQGSKARYPEISDDLITDLEKLRFDAVSVIEVNSSAEPGSMSVAHLESVNDSSSGITKSSRGVRIFGSPSVFDLELRFTEFIEELENELKISKPKGFEVLDDRAVLVGVYTSKPGEAEASMTELKELARSANLAVLDAVVQKRKMIDKRTVVGSGKLEELSLHCLDLGADLLIFDRELSPSQLRSITERTDLRVIDRSMLILDVFAQRAKSSEGRIQVELAQLKYSLPRLSDKEAGLSRLTGGIGGRGPGETKLEIGRRRARDRIAYLEKKIEQIASQRDLRREKRQSRGVPVISIVGYTNAGKSTLLNAITKSKVFAESKLFATLDTSSRRMRFPNEKEVVFVDTVGFIRELPKELVAAFRATLEEVGEADLLLHLVDASDADMKKKIEVVNNTLSDLGFSKKPSILVLNKTDLLNPLEIKALLKSFDSIAVSAETRYGFENLIKTVQLELQETFKGQDPGRFTEIAPNWNGETT